MIRQPATQTESPKAAKPAASQSPAIGHHTAPRPTRMPKAVASAASTTRIRTHRRHAVVTALLPARPQLRWADVPAAEQVQRRRTPETYQARWARR